MLRRETGGRQRVICVSLFVRSNVRVCAAEKVHTSVEIKVCDFVCMLPCEYNGWGSGEQGPSKAIIISCAARCQTSKVYTAKYP